MNEHLKVVILCGGKGSRLREETETKPKPMVEVGSLPLIWHIMKIYSHYGFDDFVLALGYKGDVIKQFFLNHEFLSNDFTLHLNNRKNDLVHYKHGEENNWKITFADTGLEAMTGARIKRVEKYVGGDNFLATYGDAVANIDIGKLVQFHKKQDTIATLTAVHPHTRWGMVREGEGGHIGEFVEKPQLFDYVNGGFFAFKKDVFDYLGADEGCVLEKEPFAKLVKDKQFSMYKHEGFWHAVDTYKDYLELNQIYDSGKAEWI